MSSKNKKQASDTTAAEVTVQTVTLSRAKIRCTKCGTVKGISADRRAKLVQKFGSEEQLVAGYLCRSCRLTADKAAKADKAAE